MRPGKLKWMRRALKMIGHGVAVSRGQVRLRGWDLRAGLTRPDLCRVQVLTVRASSHNPLQPAGAPLPDEEEEEKNLQMWFKDQRNEPLYLASRSHSVFF